MKRNLFKTNVVSIIYTIVIGALLNEISLYSVAHASEQPSEGAFLADPSEEAVPALSDEESASKSLKALQDSLTEAEVSLGNDPDDLLYTGQSQVETITLDLDENDSKNSEDDVRAEELSPTHLEESDSDEPDQEYEEQVLEVFFGSDIPSDDSFTEGDSGEGLNLNFSDTKVESNNQFFLAQPKSKSKTCQRRTNNQNNDAKQKKQDASRKNLIAKLKQKQLNLLRNLKAYSQLIGMMDPSNRNKIKVIFVRNSTLANMKSNLRMIYQLETGVIAPRNFPPSYPLELVAQQAERAGIRVRIKAKINQRLAANLARINAASNPPRVAPFSAPSATEKKVEKAVTQTLNDPSLKGVKAGKLVGQAVKGGFTAVAGIAAGTISGIVEAIVDQNATDAQKAAMVTASVPIAAGVTAAVVAKQQGKSDAEAAGAFFANVLGLDLALLAVRCPTTQSSVNRFRARFGRSPNTPGCPDYSQLPR